MKLFDRRALHGGRAQERHEAELRDKGFQVVERDAPMVPILGRRCEHGPEQLRIVAKGRTAIMVRCACGRSGPFVPVPERPLTSSETDLLVALAREASWKGLIS